MVFLILPYFCLRYLFHYARTPHNKEFLKITIQLHQRSRVTVAKGIDEDVYGDSFMCVDAICRNNRTIDTAIVYFTKEEDAPTTVSPLWVPLTGIILLLKSLETISPNKTEDTVKAGTYRLSLIGTGQSKICSCCSSWHESECAYEIIKWIQVMTAFAEMNRTVNRTY